MEVFSVLLSVVGVVVGLSGIAVTLWVFYSQINKRLEQLLIREGWLTYEQASDVLDLYFELTQLSIDDEIRAFVEQKLATCTDDALHVHVVNDTKSLISAQRNKLTRFRIRGGESLKEFLETELPTESGIVAKAQEEILRAYKPPEGETGNTSEIIARVQRVYQTFHATAQSHAHQQLRRRYLLN